LQPYEPTAKQLEMIGNVFAELPVRHRKVLKERLIGVYCIDNFSGSGIADYILGPGDDIFAVLILNPRVFSMTAGELITYRDSTVFRKDDPDIELFVDISPEISALQYIILHESTHIVDYAEDHTPFVEYAMLELKGKSTRNTSFTDEYWKGYREPVQSAEFDYRKEMRFYGLGGEASVSNRDMKEICEALAATPFASLYGSFSWAEDFSEFVTFYYLVFSLGATYEIEIKQKNDLIFSYRPMESSLVTVRVAHLDPELFEFSPQN